MNDHESAQTSQLVELVRTLINEYVEFAGNLAAHLPKAEVEEVAAHVKEVATGAMNRLEEITGTGAGDIAPPPRDHETADDASTEANSSGTRYPTSLPDVPENRWNAKKLAEATYSPGFAHTEYAVDAGTAADAEVRVLAYIDHDYEDDLRGATATAAEQLPGDRWRVKLQIPGEF